MDMSELYRYKRLLGEYELYYHEEGKHFYSVYREGKWLGTLHPSSDTWTAIDTQGHFVACVMFYPAVSYATGTYDERLLKAADSLYNNTFSV